MASLLLKIGVPLAVLAAALYPLIIKDLLFVSMGLGRTLQPISDFPYQCRRIHDPRLQSCEEMWLAEKSRQLFLACSFVDTRKEWMPNVGRLNASGRSLHDAVIAMDIDKPKDDSYEYRELSLQDYDGGANGDGRLNLVGFSGVDGTHGLNFFFVNAQPSVDPDTGRYTDNSKTGANHTIERFVLDPPSANELRHITTFSHDLISTPNNVAAVGKNAFYFTNDHGPHKTGLQHHLSPILGTGIVGYCSTSGGCKTIASGFKFPNGLLIGKKDGTLYVPQSAGAGGISVFRRTDAKGAAENIDYIDIPYGIDNLSQDAEGDIWVPAIPKVPATMASAEDPHGKVPPSTIIRVRSKKEGEGWEWEKVLEDRDGEVLPGTTTVVHDSKTGRLFFGGIFSPFITVCEKLS